MNRVKIVLPNRINTILAFIGDLPQKINFDAHSSIIIDNKVDVINIINRFFPNNELVMDSSIDSLSISFSPNVENPLIFESAVCANSKNNMLTTTDMQFDNYISFSLGRYRILEEFDLSNIGSYDNLSLGEMDFIKE